MSQFIAKGREAAFMIRSLLEAKRDVDALQGAAPSPAVRDCLRYLADIDAALSSPPITWSKRARDQLSEILYYRGGADHAMADSYVADRVENLLREYEDSFALGFWRPIETAPRDGSYILVAGPSGYTTTPLRVEVCRWYEAYRPRDPWVTYSNDNFRDGGSAPTLWHPLPKDATEKKP